MKKIMLSIAFAVSALFAWEARAQVTTNFNNDKVIDERGRFVKPFKAQVDFEIPAKSIDALLEKERKALASNDEGKPFQFAEPVTVNLPIARTMQWKMDGEYAYGKYAIKAKGAFSTSINFDRFVLPKNTEMYVYNANGNMITGPVTEKENNDNKFWGSWAYKGEDLFIEIKTPAATIDQLQLHANNIAYGYKQIYKTEVAAFGASQTCNINVLCPLGNGWEAERNAVALILNDVGSSWCSGSLVMNTCGTNTPYFLTANHCFTGQNVAQWKFTFQAWSPTCTPSANSNGVTFNGSTLRANSAATDFCLVELNNIPAANSGINYAGWSRNTNGITQGTIIHHPSGDVMKITRDNQAPVFSNFSGASCWLLAVDQGATEGGSSGSPYFDQDHRIIAQHFGINDANLSICQRVNKFGGRFDLSWTGGGTNATRLSNWLDPGGIGATTTNTTNISGLHPFLSNNFNLMSYDNNLDVGTEPNPSTNIWSSNDIWNRRNNIGNPNDHQEPGYATAALNNIMKLRIRNVGCKASPIANAKMYWTMASMGEQWQVDWDGTSQLCGTAASGEVTTPNTGQTYTPGAGFQVPALQPNQSFIVEGKWMPKNPLVDYACMQPGMGSEPMICFLGRILSTTDPMFNEVLGPIGPNVKNNNNIVTRNTKLVNLPGSYSKKIPIGGTVLAHNYLDVSTRFNIRLTALTPQSTQFGNIGSTVVTLSDAMWEAWVRGGSRAEGMSLVDPRTHEFSVYNFDNAVLNNIEMQPDEYMNIGVGFVLNRPISTREEYQFTISQELMDASPDAPPYGSDCIYVVVISDEEAEMATANRQAGNDNVQRMAPTANSVALTVKPNPTEGKAVVQFNMPQNGAVSMTLTNASGRIVKSFGQKIPCVKGQNQLPIDVSGIDSGTYLVTITTLTGKQTVKLIIKQ